MSSLPLIDPTRTEFGRERTVCSCDDCTVFCYTMPGYLIPADLDRLMAKANITSAMALSWSVGRLLASPGPLVAKNGELYRIHTLVPDRLTGGACRFLDENDRCLIHAIAPYGCSFFTSHMSEEEGDRASMAGLHEVDLAWKEKPLSLYARVWNYLESLRLRSPGPEQSRTMASKMWAERQARRAGA